jgi:hypothetical protein
MAEARPGEKSEPAPPTPPALSPCNSSSQTARLTPAVSGKWLDGRSRQRAERMRTCDSKGSTNPV